jgi:hypothetical protein
MSYDPTSWTSERARLAHLTLCRAPETEITEAATVMAYVIAYIEKREMVRVTCPVREVGDFAGIPKSTAARALKSLTEKGFLMQFSRGFRSKDTSMRKAAIYYLSDPFSLRYGGRGAPSATMDVWKHYVADRDAPEWVRLRERGGCVLRSRNRPT